MVVRYFNSLTGAQTKGSSQHRRSNWKFVLAAVALCFGSAGITVAHASDKDDCGSDIPDRLFAQNIAPSTATPAMAADAVVPMPSITPYYPIRFDGSAYVLMDDMTVNMTSALNEFYYDPKWRGEVWGPFQQYEIVEKQTRLLPTWQDYDQFSWWRTCNLWHKFWERSSGFGP